MLKVAKWTDTSCAVMSTKLLSEGLLLRLKLACLNSIIIVLCLLVVCLKCWWYLMLGHFGESIYYLACFRLELPVTNLAIPFVVHVCENAIKRITSVLILLLFAIKIILESLLAWL